MYSREDFIHFRVTPVERQAIYQMAQSEHRKVSAMMRKIVQEAAWSRGIIVVVKQEQTPAKQNQPG